MVITGFGAVWPRPHSEVEPIVRESSSSSSRSSSLPSPAQIRSRISSILTVPSRQGVHWPHDSSRVKWTK